MKTTPAEETSNPADLDSGSLGDRVPASSAPAVHDGELWDGPRWIHNASEHPVWVETKEQYWALLNKLGFTMKDQQESTTGPEQPSVPWIAPDLPPAETPLRQFDAEDAAAFQGISAVYRRYDLREALMCERCFRRGERSGCRTIVTSRRIRVECRCGIREYVGPAGVDLTTNLPANARVLNDRTSTDLTTTTGQTVLPTDILSKQEAQNIARYVECLGRHDLEAVWLCHRCCQGHATSDDAMSVQVTGDQIVATCKCRVLFFVGSSQ